MEQVELQESNQLNGPGTGQNVGNRSLWRLITNDVNELTNSKVHFPFFNEHTQRWIDELAGRWPKHKQRWCFF